MNLHTFLPAGKYKYKGGGEYAGPCPRCGGEDRFVFWPEHPSGAVGGKFLCRGCTPGGGDGIQFAMDFLGMSFTDACAAFRYTTARQKVSSPRPSAWTPKEAKAPGEAWQTAAATFLAWCCKHRGCAHEYDMGNC